MEPKTAIRSANAIPDGRRSQKRPWLGGWKLYGNDCLLVSAYWP